MGRDAHGCPFGCGLDRFDAAEGPVEVGGYDDFVNPRLARAPAQRGQHFAPRHQRVRHGGFEQYMPVAIAVCAVFQNVAGQHLDHANLTRPCACGCCRVKIAMFEQLHRGENLRAKQFGSAAVMGTVDVDIMRGLSDKEGNKLIDVLPQHGVDIDNMDGAQTRVADAKAYVEVHIEQGPILESMNLGICTVTGTKGIERERLIFKGQAAHAGTMPMPMRRDSFRAAARFALAVADIGENHDGVTTVGAVACKPGVVTAVAGETTITLDMRHIDADELAAMYSESIAAAHSAAEAEGCTVEFEHIFRIPPMPFHPELLEAARTSVREVEGHDVELPSGALHDASEMARSIPTVMIFSSSIAGLSHTKEEDTSDEHLFMAVDAFNRTCRRAIQLMVDGKL